MDGDILAIGGQRYGIDVDIMDDTNLGDAATEQEQAAALRDELLAVGVPVGEMEPAHGLWSGGLMVYRSPVIKQQDGSYLTAPPRPGYDHLRYTSLRRLLSDLRRRSGR